MWDAHKRPLSHSGTDTNLKSGKCQDPLGQFDQSESEANDKYSSLPVSGEQF